MSQEQSTCFAHIRFQVELQATPSRNIRAAASQRTPMISFSRRHSIAFCISNIDYSIQRLFRERNSERNWPIRWARGPTVCGTPGCQTQQETSKKKQELMWFLQQSECIQSCGLCYRAEPDCGCNPSMPSVLTHCCINTEGKAPMCERRAASLRQH